MNQDIRKIYINLVKYKAVPRDMFRDWNRVKAIANLENIYVPELYPQYIRILMGYRNETSNGS